MRIRREREPRVVVTGIGLCTSLGATREASWSAILRGETRCRSVSPGASIASGPFFGHPIDSNPGGVRRLLVQTAREAIEDAELLASGVAPERVAVVVGLSKGDVAGLEAFHGPGPRPDWVAHWPHAGATEVAREWDFRGPSLAPVAACATGLIAALRGVDLIQRGEADAVLVGAADASLTPLMLGAFARMGALARVNDPTHPASAVRPWDRRRTGFLVGEGAAVLVLENAEHARARGVRPYCVLAGGAFGSDAYHITSLDADPTTLAHVVEHALKRSDIEGRRIDHVNVHGTATRFNDPLECQALRRALGPRAVDVTCAANKPQIGHCLGAAGAVELAITCLSMRDGVIPRTLFLEDRDPACDLDITSDGHRVRLIQTALKLSLGFGGHLAAAVLQRADDARSFTEPIAP
ncbi:MAG: beta-ketoacyl-[acyl-carrier-protein] synthase family protein [Isosphaeraceae bacterium]